MSSTSMHAAFPMLIDDEAGLIKSFNQAKQFEQPYRYWTLTRCLQEGLIDEIMSLPFEAASLEGVSGKRELHNPTRNYFDQAAIAKFPACARVARMFQEKSVTDAIKKRFAAEIDGCFLRIEFAQDVDGFWLEPHTDLGVKKFTYLLYLFDNAQHRSLGTDIYDENRNWVGRAPYARNAGMIFIPSTKTYHGFEPRPIESVRTSLVINFVTDAWRAREQLAFPNQPVS
ncbi:MAG: 2OG-Fe(II) oxygenase [Hyphomicrobium sp.]